MRFDPDQLDTLVAITEEGTFDAAARRLHLTPSAVSQRVRALERAAGQVLVRRTSPATVTSAGEPLVRLGRQMRLLVEEASLTIGSSEALALAVAINADSLATWFPPVLAAVARRPGLALRLQVEDQGYSHDLLRSGEVLAAVTSEPVAVQGCVVEPLGSLRYIAAAAPSVIERHRRGRGVDWSTMPVVVFNEKDHLQDQILAQQQVDRPAVVHRVPTTGGFQDAVVHGLGWGLLPEEHLARGISAGTLQRVPGAKPIDVPLFWQRWRLDSRTLNELGEDVQRAAAASLRRPRPAGSSVSRAAP